MPTEFKLVLGTAVMLAILAAAAGLRDVRDWWKEFKARRAWRAGR